MYFIVGLAIYSQHNYCEVLSCCVYQYPVPFLLLDRVPLDGHTTNLPISVDGHFLGPGFQLLQMKCLCTLTYKSLHGYMFTFLLGYR